MELRDTIPGILSVVKAAEREGLRGSFPASTPGVAGRDPVSGRRADEAGRCRGSHGSLRRLQWMEWIRLRETRSSTLFLATLERGRVLDHPGSIAGGKTSIPFRIEASRP